MQHVSAMLDQYFDYCSRSVFSREIERGLVAPLVLADPVRGQAVLKEEHRKSDIVEA